jgi:hypothetical protein
LFGMLLGTLFGMLLGIFFGIFFGGARSRALSGSRHNMAAYALSAGAPGVITSVR